MPSRPPPSKDLADRGGLWGSRCKDTAAVHLLVAGLGAQRCSASTGPLSASPTVLEGMKPGARSLDRADRAVLVSQLRIPFG